MVLYGISLASSLLAEPDRPKAAGFSAKHEFVGVAAVWPTKSGAEPDWCSHAAFFLKLYSMKIMALHRGLNVTERVIHGPVSQRLTRE